MKKKQNAKEIVERRKKIVNELVAQECEKGAEQVSGRVVLERLARGEAITVNTLRPRLEEKAAMPSSIRHEQRFAERAVQLLADITCPPEEPNTS